MDDSDEPSIEASRRAVDGAWRQVVDFAGAGGDVTVSWGEPAARLLVKVDPDAPRYRPSAGEGVEVEEVAPGIHLIGFADD